MCGHIHTGWHLYLRWFIFSFVHNSADNANNSFCCECVANSNHTSVQYTRYRKNSNHGQLISIISVFIFTVFLSFQHANTFNLLYNFSLFVWHLFLFIYLFICTYSESSSKRWFYIYIHGIGLFMMNGIFISLALLPFSSNWLTIQHTARIKYYTFLFVFYKIYLRSNTRSKRKRGGKRAYIKLFFWRICWSMVCCWLFFYFSFQM